MTTFKFLSLFFIIAIARFSYAGDVCKLKSDPGPCYGYFERFFYNQKTEECEKFVYGGCGGNGNNFKQKQDCEKTCNKCETGENPDPQEDVCSLPKKVGPCTAAIQRYYFNSASGKCEIFTYGGCQANGNNFKTLEECDNRCPPVDVCLLPKKVGPCHAAIQRYYFNTDSGKCEDFTHGGCEANGNNFKTLIECYNRCPPVDVCLQPKKVGPCYGAIQRYYFNTDSGKCEDFTYGGCEANGNNFKTLIECHNRCPPVDVCLQPKKVGPCYGAIQRYYFNTDSGKCEVFTYGGCEANGNNFKTLIECYNRCPPVDVCLLPKKVGPCYGAIQRYYFNTDSGKCEVFTYGGCEANGNNFKTLVECYSRCPPVDVCSLPKNVGPCKAAFQRYYFNTASGKCELFTYGGCEANGNNFETLEECDNRCPPVDACSLPKKVGPCKAAIQRYYFNTASGKCEIFTYGGCEANGNNFETLEECDNRCSPVDVCSLPKKVGPCKAAIQRYYFNSASGNCEIFIYGGCQANGNNFETLEDCENICPPVDVCTLPQKAGPCEAAIERYYFNTASGKCEIFIFGGCKANGNNFKTLEECDNRCPTVDVCSLPKKVGPCRAAIPRYYYNSDSGTCETFTYGGCQANGNNFETLEDCENRCYPENICELKPEVGPCHGAFKRYYYDPATNKCKKFSYGGCGGNDNNFENRISCEDYCKY